MIMSKPLRGEVWLVDLNPTIGKELSKKRPCLVLSANSFNQGPAELLIIVPLTSKQKNNPLHISLQPPEGGVSTASFILPEHIRSLSSERFANRLGKVHEETLGKVEYVLQVLLDLG
jgi:mRNA interferase MazF